MARKRKPTPGVSALKKEMGKSVDAKAKRMKTGKVGGLVPKGNTSAKKKSAAKTTPKAKAKTTPKAKAKVTATAKPQGMPAQPTSKVGMLGRAARVAGPLSVLGTGAMLIDYGRKVVSEKAKTPEDRKKSIQGLRRLRSKAMNKTEGMPAQPKVEKNPYRPDFAGKGKNKIKTPPGTGDKSGSGKATSVSKPKTKSVSRADQDAENMESKGIGLSPTTKSAPKSSMRNTPDSSMKAPSLETPQKGYGADNPNPRGETYGDRNDDSTMPDMLDKKTEGEYREKQYDRVIKNFVSSMFGRG